MRTVSLNVYTIDELAPAARQKAIDDNRASVAEFLNDDDASEYQACLERIEEIFDIDVYDWSVDSCRAYFRFRFTSARWEELADDPRFLVRYLNETERYCRNGRYYFKSVRGADGKWGYKTRRSRVLSERNCPLTGTWVDEAVEHFTGDYRWECVRSHNTIRGYVYDMLDRFFENWRDDRENNESDETVEEHLSDNCYDFLEDGKTYN